MHCMRVRERVRECGLCLGGGGAETGSKRFEKCEGVSRSVNTCKRLTKGAGGLPTHLSTRTHRGTHGQLAGVQSG